jgi:hypothetical protein
VNAYGCGFYRLTGLATDAPKLANVYSIQTPKAKERNGACSIPVLLGSHWLMPVGRENALVTLDVSNPAQPRETSRLAFPSDFAPHWLSKDPRSNRLVLGAELGGEQGMYVLEVDPATGRVRMDSSVGSSERPGYLDFRREKWPHGQSGPAWAHAAVFLPLTE